MSRVMATDGYLLANQNIEAGARFEALAEIFDPVTFAHFDRIGVGPGWHCWEVGAGGTSVIYGLADRVGENGRILATDIDASWAERASERAPIEVRKHDVSKDPLPEGKYDLVHARLVLVHVPDRQTALENMVAALKPGGWLLIEDADPALQPLACINPNSPEEVLANRLRSAFRSLMIERGADLEYGRKLPHLLRAIGLQNVGADGYFPLGLPACNVLEIATMKLVASQLLQAGLAVQSEIDEHIDNISRGRLVLTLAPMISAWGQKRNVE
ncbi:MAG TPA: methyltransferase domain-containing protein [Chroococcales cyanobacterium]